MSWNCHQRKLDWTQWQIIVLDSTDQPPTAPAPCPFWEVGFSCRLLPGVHKDIPDWRTTGIFTDDIHPGTTLWGGGISGQDVGSLPCSAVWGLGMEVRSWVGKLISIAGLWTKIGMAVPGLSWSAWLNLLIEPYRAVLISEGRHTLTYLPASPRWCLPYNKMFNTSGYPIWQTSLSECDPSMRCPRGQFLISHWWFWKKCLLSLPANVFWMPGKHTADRTN